MWPLYAVHVCQRYLAHSCMTCAIAMMRTRVRACRWPLGQDRFLPVCGPTVHALPLTCHNHACTDSAARCRRRRQSRRRTHERRSSATRPRTMLPPPSTASTECFAWRCSQRAARAHSVQRAAPGVALAWQGRCQQCRRECKLARKGVGQKAAAGRPWHAGKPARQQFAACAQLVQPFGLRGAGCKGVERSHGSDQRSGARLLGAQHPCV